MSFSIIKKAYKYLWGKGKINSQCCVKLSHRDLDMDYQWSKEREETAVWSLSDRKNKPKSTRRLID